MSESPSPYNNQPRHEPNLQRRIIHLAREIAELPDAADKFALFCCVYYHCRGERPEIRARLLRVVELIAEHPQRGELWPEVEETYRIKAAEAKL